MQAVEIGDNAALFVEWGLGTRTCANTDLLILGHVDGGNRVETSMFSAMMSTTPSGNYFVPATHHSTHAPVPYHAHARPIVVNGHRRGCNGSWELR